MNGCPARGVELGRYIDGELDGMGMLRVARHLETCRACAEALFEMQSVGEALRAGVSGDLPQAMFDGLASDVVSRSRAESAVSWRATLSRGLDDWHWAIVGVGSVAATFVSTSLLSVLLAFGPAPERDDSLSALVNNLAAPAGYFFVFASTTGDAGQDVVMLQVENGRPVAPRLVSDLVVSRVNGSATEAVLVEQFQRIVMRDGRMVSLDALSPQQRKAANALLDEITRLRTRESDPEPAGQRSFQVHEMRLVTSTGVSAKRS